MSPLFLAFSLLVILGLFICPRKWTVPVLILGLSCSVYQVRLPIGGTDIPAFRVLLAAALFRVVLRGELRGIAKNPLDKWVNLFGVILFGASLLHETSPTSGPYYILAPILNMVGLYWVSRATIRTIEEVLLCTKAVMLSTVHVGLGMLVEKATGQNLFALFAGVSQPPIIRNGSLRAVGPYSHPILAGALGAALAGFYCLKNDLPLWIRRASLAGALIMVFSSASSGPILTLMAVFGLMMIWKWREKLSRIPAILFFAYLIAYPFSTRPPYYFIARIDLTGGSTGFHRAMLIEQTINHFNEWWLYGTDRTRHWMPMQGANSENHTDITNYFIVIGVTGGAFALACFCYILYRTLAQSYQLYTKSSAISSVQWLAWSYALVIIGNITTSMSVSFFGQPMAFFWICLANVATLFCIEANEENAFEDGRA